MKRGTGLKGISNITVSDPHFLDSNIIIFRPLITNTKQEIIEYCKHYNIAYVMDPTNSNEDYSEKLELSFKNNYEHSNSMKVDNLFMII